jgi:hypothetical protein
MHSRLDEHQLAGGAIGVPGDWRPVSAAGDSPRRMKISATGEIEIRLVVARAEVSRFLLPAGAAPVDVPVGPDAQAEIRRSAGNAQATTAAVELLDHQAALYQ